MDRKYQMTRVRRGDYLLPSNDAKWLWRIYSYDEDGSLYVGDYLNQRQVRGTFWACARRPMPSEGTPLDDVLAWGDAWEFWAGPLTTRKAAMEEALLAGERVAAVRER